MERMLKYSFVIITYNRMIDTKRNLEVLLKLDDFDKFVDNIVVFNNNSDEDYKGLESWINNYKNITYIKSDSNHGVSRGRNLASNYASGDILIFIDDDAEFENTDILQVFDKNFKNENLGVLTFQVKNYFSQKRNPIEFPHINKNLMQKKEDFFTYFYLGGASAIRRSLFEKVGKYPDDFFYGMEEYDLSYKILDLGYNIKYTNSIIMLHKNNPKGRKPENTIVQYKAENKIKVAIRNLPFKYFCSHLFLWTIKSYLNTKSLKIMKNVFVNSLKNFKKIDRNVIKEKTQVQVKELGGKLEY